MSGTWPTSPGFMAVNFGSVEYNLQSGSIVGHSDAFDLIGQRFEFTAQYNNMTYATFLPIWAFAMAQKGGAETFTITLPEISDNQGSASGSVTINGAHSAGVESLTLAGLSGTLVAGQCFTIAGDPKVYVTTADRTGPGSVAIRPALMEALTGGEAVTYSGVEFTCRMRAPVHKFPLSLPGHIRYEIDMYEAF